MQNVLAVGVVFRMHFALEALVVEATAQTARRHVEPQLLGLAIVEGEASDVVVPSVVTVTPRQRRLEGGDEEEQRESQNAVRLGCQRKDVVEVKLMIFFQNHREGCNVQSTLHLFKNVDIRINFVEFTFKAKQVQRHLKAVPMPLPMGRQCQIPRGPKPRLVAMNVAEISQIHYGPERPKIET